MRLLDWLFGGKEQRLPAGPEEESGAEEVAREHRPASPAGCAEAGPASESENLRRWRESGQPRAWVEAHRGQWGHAEWLDLLEGLKRSAYWPMHPDQVGLVLEELKRDWLHRN